MAGGAVGDAALPLEAGRLSITLIAPPESLARDLPALRDLATSVTVSPTLAYR